MAIADVRFDELGNLVVALVPQGAHTVLLYVEFDDGVVGPSLFYKLGGVLRYVERINDLVFAELRRLQLLFGADVRAMEFQIQGENFSTEFTYADQFEYNADVLAREEAVLRKHFGHSNVET